MPVQNICPSARSWCVCSTVGAPGKRLPASSFHSPVINRPSWRRSDSVIAELKAHACRKTLNVVVRPSLPAK